MNAAKTSKRNLNDTKLLILSGKSPIHATVGDIPGYLNSGDLFVINDSGTLPSSFKGHVQRTGLPLELRLASFQGPNVHSLQSWLAFSFGAGDWRIPTEKRGPPPQIFVGDQIIFGNDLSAEVIQVQFECLVQIRFVSDQLEKALYKYGRPIQYSYLASDLKIWDQQTIFSGSPISVEPPSAGFPFTWETIFRLKAKGIQIASITHGSGISSTGSKHLDSLLPLAEWYEVPPETADLVNYAKKKGQNVVALGTTVLRAMESAMRNGRLVASSGLTLLKIIPGHKVQSATSLFTGIHELGTSHMEILNAFCGRQIIEAGYQEAKKRGYLAHEYGDLSLLDC